MVTDTFYLRVAGVSHYQEGIALVRDGDRCELVPEPENPHDPDAIRVVCRSETIGYVPRGDHTATLREIGKDPRAEVVATIAGVGRPAGADCLGVRLRLDLTYDL